MDARFTEELNVPRSSGEVSLDPSNIFANCAFGLVKGHTSMVVMQWSPSESDAVNGSMYTHT
jgi:hypothetical protein